MLGQDKVPFQLHRNALIRQHNLQNTTFVGCSAVRYGSDRARRRLRQSAQPRPRLTPMSHSIAGRRAGRARVRRALSGRMLRSCRLLVYRPSLVSQYAA
jgi:hypothetical protein